MPFLAIPWVEHRPGTADALISKPLRNAPSEPAPPRRSGSLWPPRDPDRFAVRSPAWLKNPLTSPSIPDWTKLLDGKVAVVTGGGDGIGGAISRLFAEHGAKVEIAEIDPERAEHKQTEITDAGGTACAHVVDVRVDDEVAGFAETVVAEHGGVDVLVNNVGDYRPLVRFSRSTPESWDAMYQVNLRHFFAVTRAFLDPMIESGGGSIVNVHSVEGMRGYPGEPVYGAMKAAVAHFTTCLAVEQGRHGIRVNGIGPDLTQSPQVDYVAGQRVRLDVGVVGAGRSPRLARGPGAGPRCSSRPTCRAS